MNISMIAAVAANGVIGNGDHLPWHCPEDMKHFVEITKNNIVVMGRKTHESIGKLLSHRVNFVLSRDKDYRSPYGATCYSNSRDILDFAEYYPSEIIVIGGEQIYREFLPYARKLYITNINAPFAGDAYFPSIHDLDWVCAMHEPHEPSANTPFSFDFNIYIRAKQ